ncbi:Aste57867_17659 [Aphanomyces stellatus]|uniref:Aste57867_17659 protein n=1 Tax=Aphanomyces stellatus TaxID=120398 RepID=A0A485L8B5_9STRA|nr:hypothetical protein As57867_017598 [Aphanomyces stellatus]VFT94410.1 Aste57867_17659 [Aphanomyces stellatus]
MGLNDPPIDAALIEKQLALLAHLGILDDGDSPHEHRHQPILLRGEHEQLVTRPSSRCKVTNTAPLQSKKIPTLEQAHHDGVVETRSPMVSTALVPCVQANSHNRSSKATRRDALADPFRLWRHFAADSRQLGIAARVHDSRLRTAFFAQWKCFTARQRNHTMHEDAMQIWRLHQHLHRWQDACVLPRRQRQWDTKHRRRLLARALLQRKFVRWKDFWGTRATHHDAARRLSDMARRHQRHRVMLLLARNRWMCRRERRACASPFAQWRAAAATRIDRRLYEAETIESMQQFHAHATVRAWIVFVTRRRESESRRRHAINHVKSTFFHAWRRTLAENRLRRVHRGVLVARVIRAWRQMHEATLLLKLWQQHWHLHLAQSCLQSWHAHTQTRVRRAIAAVALEDWRLERSIAHWHTRALRSHDRTIKHHRASTVHVTRLLSRVFRALAIAAEIQYSRVRQATHLHRKHVQRRVLHAFARTAQVERLSRVQTKCAARHRRHHVTTHVLTAWIFYVAHRRRRNAWLTVADAFLARQRMAAGVARLWQCRQQDKDDRVARREARRQHARGLKRACVRHWVAVVRATQDRTRLVHLFWARHCPVHHWFRRWTDAIRDAHDAALADAYADAIRRRRCWRHWVHAILATQACRQLQARRHHRWLSRATDQWQAFATRRCIHHNQVVLADALSTRLCMSSHFRGWLVLTRTRRRVAAHAAVVVDLHHMCLTVRMLMTWRAQWLLEQRVQAHRAHVDCRTHRRLFRAWRRWSQRHHYVAALESMHVERRKTQQLVASWSQWRQYQVQARQKALAEWNHRRRVARPCFHHWRGVTVLQLLMQRWAIYARHRAASHTVTGTIVRQFREDKTVAHVFRRWCCFVDGVVIWRHELMTAKHACLVDVKATVRARKLAEMYRLYACFHAFAVRALRNRRAADWFQLRHRGLRCLRAWWKVVLVQTQTKLLRDTQAMKKVAGGLPAAAMMTTYAARQPAKATSAARVANPAHDGRHTGGQTARQRVQPIPAAPSPAKRPVKTPPKEPPPVQVAKSTSRGRKPMAVSAPVKEAPACVTPNEPRSSTSIEAPPPCDLPLEFLATTPTRDNTDESLDTRNDQQRQSLPLPPPVELELLEPPESPRQLLSIATTPTRIQLSPVSSALDQLAMISVHSHDGEGTRGVGLESFPLCSMQLEQPHESLQRSPVRDLMALANAQQDPRSTPFESSLARLPPSPQRHRDNIMPPPPLRPHLPPVIPPTPQVTWNEDVIACYERYVSANTTSNLSPLGHCALQLLDIVRSLGWLYNALLFRESKRFVTEALGDASSPPPKTTSVDVTIFCKYLDLVANHRHELRVDVWTKDQANHLRAVDADYDTMPALAGCAHLKWLLCFHPPRCLGGEDGGMPEGMRNAQVVCLVEKHRKFLRSLFVLPSSTKITTPRTPQSFDQLRLGPDDFVLICKTCNVFPMFFTRRELIGHFERSSSGPSGDLTFPEFIECLFRCSERFFAACTDGNSIIGPAEKFQALLHAMDGHGSILQKNSVVDPVAQAESLARVQRSVQLATPSPTARRRQPPPPPRSPKASDYVHQPSPLDQVYRPTPRVDVPILEKALRNAQLKFLRGKYPTTQS